jgi:F-type H+-transporting ATPase subunit delta
MNLRGASADALATLSERLPSSDAEKEAATLGEELFGVAAVLREQPGLRRVLTDNSVAADAKAGLAEKVFGSAVAEPTMRVVTDASAARWTASSDIIDALEELATTCTVRSGGKDAGRVSDELFAVRRLVHDSAELREAVADPSRSVADKNSLLRGLLESQLMSATMRLVEQAVAGHDGPMVGALALYERRAAAVLEQVVATVHTARPLDDEVRTRLTEALTKQYDAQVHVDEVVEPDLVGGMRIEIGDDVIDGTVQSRLDDARRRLVG